MNYTSMTSIATNSTLVVVLDDDEENDSIDTSVMCQESDTISIIDDITAIQDESVFSKSFDELPPEAAMSVIIGFFIAVFLALVVAPLST